MLLASVAVFVVNMFYGVLCLRQLGFSKLICAWRSSLDSTIFFFIAGWWLLTLVEERQGMQNATLNIHGKFSTEITKQAGDSSFF